RAAAVRHTAVDIRGAGVYEPPVSGLDSNRRVAARMTGHRQGEDLRREPLELPHSGYAFPRLAKRLVRLPHRPVRELRPPVPLLLIEGRAGKRCTLFFRMHMDLRLGEVRQTARMVEIEMPHHDVPHVLSP